MQGIADRRQTKTDQVYERIRSDIFSSELAPGARLKFPDLCVRYETSVGVAREALARLAAERLVRPQAHQGYSVVELSAEDLTDLTTAREEIEPLTFRLSIAHGDAVWESGVVAAHHLLSIRHKVVLNTGIYDDEWHAAHENFHAALLSACPSQRLTGYSTAMRAESVLYRHWAGRMPSTRARDVADEHRGLLEAALNRDVASGPIRLRDHISLTTRIIFEDTVEGSRRLSKESPAI